MRKVLGLLVACFMVLGAIKAMADTRSDSLNTDPQFMDDMDLIWLYPNLVTKYKNVFDIRTDYFNTGGTWGGFLDGQHTGLGTVGAYVHRPYGDQGQMGWNSNEVGWYGTGFGWYGAWNNSARFSAAPYGGHFAPTTPENKVDLFWGDSMDKGNIGVQINYADAYPGGNDLAGTVPQNGSTSNSAANSNQTKSVDDIRVLGLNVGLGLADLGPFAEANLHAGYSMGSLNIDDKLTNSAANSTVNEASLKDNGISTIQLGAVLKNNIDENSDLRVFADAYIDQNNQTEMFTSDATGNGLHNEAGDIDQEFTSKYNDVIVDLGAGCNHKVLDGKATVSSGLGVFWANTDQKYGGTTQDGTATTTTYVQQNAGAGDEITHDDMDLNWRANVEAKATDWLTIRAGITRPIIWQRVTTTTVNVYNASGNGAVDSSTKTTTIRDEWFGNNGETYAMGFGVNWQNWEVDANCNVGSVYNSIANVAPGNGIFFNNNTGTNNATDHVGAIVTSYNADLRFRF